jgi:hypothetical protein
MPTIPVAEWVPDAAELGNPGSIRIVNALPGTNSYKPVPRFVPLTDGLDLRARGAAEAKDKDGNVLQYAGDAESIYVLAGTSWSKVGEDYTTDTEEVWDFARWKNKILATNFTDNPQSIELGGPEFEEMTDAFRARRIAVVGDFVVAANTVDAFDGAVPDRIRWSAINNETDWVVSSTTGADVRDLKRGPIQRIFGGEYGVIMGLESTFRMDFTGAPTWFQIQETLPEIGLIAPGAAARIGDLVFAWSNQGFVVIQSGTGFQPIGAGRVDAYAFADLDESSLHRISCVADPASGRVFWAYPGSGNSSGTPNKVIVYDKNFNRWSIIEQEVELLWRASGVGVTIEDLDAVVPSLDALGISLDSSRWKGGGNQILAAFDSDNRHGFFSGTPMDAIVETRETEIHAGRRTMLNSFVPLVDGGSVTAQVGHRSRQTDHAAFGPVLSQSRSGRFTTRSNARFHRFRLNVTGYWSDIIGVQVNPTDARAAEQRG